MTYVHEQAGEMGSAHAHSVKEENSKPANSSNEDTTRQVHTTQIVGLRTGYELLFLGKVHLFFS